MATPTPRINSYNAILNDFQNKVQQFQDECNHKKLSKWIEVQWAIGHGTGHYIRRCERCNMSIYEKVLLNICRGCEFDFPYWLLTCPVCDLNVDTKEWKPIQIVRLIPKKEFNKRVEEHKKKFPTLKGQR